MPERTESIQLVAFLRSPSAGDAIALWMRLGIGSPTAFQTISPGHTQAQGSIDAINITVSVRPERVDFTIQPKSQVYSASPAMPPSLNDPVGATNLGVQYFSKLFDVLSVGRTACVLQGTDVAKDAYDAVSKIVGQVPSIPVTKDTNDVQFQISSNKECVSIPAQVIGRVCKWQTVSINILQNTSYGVTNIETKHAAMSYIDIAGQGMIIMSSDQSIAQTREVVAEAMRIFDGGFNALG